MTLRQKEPDSFVYSGKPSNRTSGPVSKLVFLTAFVVTLVAFGVTGVLGADPQTTASTEMDEVGVELRISPGAVDPGGSFEIDLRLRNQRPDSLVLTSRARCLAHPATYADGHPVPMNGMHNGCVSRPDTFRIGPGEELREQWKVRAAWGETPTPAGVYSVRMHLNVPDMPELVGQIRVR